MTSNSGYIEGDQINQYGHHNTGKIQNQYQYQDSQAALVSAVQALRSQVSDADRRVLDDSLDIVRAGPSVEPGAMRRALASIAGVAVVVGEIGAPVTAAVNQVVTALFNT
ncbi:hypothetical protein ACQEVX_10590 [Streptomyces syringium]|uniref:hypothetical protein n=1 Tax=Streptomyces syringium TaxID=76729 RepID=UPI003D8F655A